MLYLLLYQYLRIASSSKYGVRTFEFFSCYGADDFDNPFINSVVGSRDAKKERNTEKGYEGTMTIKLSSRNHDERVNSQATLAKPVSIQTKSGSEKCQQSA